MKIPNFSEGVNREFYIRRRAFSDIKAALARSPGGVPKCTCIQHGDSTVWECCKFGSDECRSCVGETTDDCCNNLIKGRPSPTPLPVIFAF